MDQEVKVEIKPTLPNPVTTDQAFLKLVVERLDLTNALLLDMLSDIARLNNNVIDVKAGIRETKTVSVNFDVEKLAERLSASASNDPSFPSDNTANKRTRVKK